MSFPEATVAWGKKGGGVTTVEQERPIEDVEVQRNALRVMDHNGDTLHTWDPENETEVAAVKKVFKALKKDGYLAYTVNPADRSKDEVIQGDKFPKDAAQIIMSPQMQGG